MTEAELNQIGRKLGVTNCGGKGGKPGPCKISHSEHATESDVAKGNEIAKAMGGRLLKVSGGGGYQKVFHVEHDDPKSVISKMERRYGPETDGYRRTDSGSTSMGRKGAQSLAVAKNPTFKGPLGSLTPGQNAYRVIVHKTGNHITSILD